MGAKLESRDPATSHKSLSYLSSGALLNDVRLAPAASSPPLGIPSPSSVGRMPIVSNLPSLSIVSPALPPLHLLPGLPKY